MTPLVFDLDGTLIDSVHGIAATTSAILQDAGRRAISVEEARGFIGDGLGALLRRAFAATGEPREPDAELCARWEAHYTTQGEPITPLFPGIRALLDHLAAAGHPLGLCTNKPLAPTERVLARLGLDHFSTVVAGDSLPVRKPHPEHLLATVRALGHHSALYVGDSPTDAATAERAQLPFICVTWGYSRVPQASLPAHAHVDTVDTLQQAIVDYQRGTTTVPSPAGGRPHTT